MKRLLLLANHLLIVAFGLASGGYKLLGGIHDLEIFASLGMGAFAVRFFGALQASTAVGSLVPAFTRPCALLLAGCNLLATVGLFAHGQLAFAATSLVFVAMALLPAWRPTFSGLSFRRSATGQK